MVLELVCCDVHGNTNVVFSPFGSLSVFNSFGVPITMLGYNM